MAATRSLIVLDRDGVLNALIPNPTEPRPDSPLRTAEVVVFDWVPAVLRDLTHAGFGIAIASNQQQTTGDGTDHPRFISRSAASSVSKIAA